MQVLMVDFEFPPLGGGAGQAHRCLLEEYAKHDELVVDVLTAGLEKGWVEEQFAERIRLYKIGVRKRSLHYWRKGEVLGWLARAVPAYRRLVRENQYDVGHTFFAFPSGYCCYRAARELPYVVSLRGSDVPGYNARLGLDYVVLGGLFRRIWRGASAVVANSSGLRQLALQFMPTLEIGVIPNGVNAERFRPGEQRELRRPIRALSVGRLIGRKRIDLQIGAIAAARRRGVEVTLTVAGEGELLEQLRRRAAEAEVLEQVVFLGRVAAARMPEVYREHDVFVMSSAHEGMSNAMLEAMASGLPVVTTRCEGVGELVGDNGLVAERADAEALADCLVRLARNEQGYRAMCAAARERAKRFSWRPVAEKYWAIYRAIAEERKNGGAGGTG